MDDDRSIYDSAMEFVRANPVPESGFDAPALRALYAAEWPRLVEAAQAAESLGNDADALSLLEPVIRLLTWTQQTTEAERILGHALPIARRSGDARSEASALNYLSSVYGLTGRKAESTAATEQALEAARRAGDAREESRALTSAGMRAASVGCLADARSHIDLAIETARRASLPRQEAAALMSRATLHNTEHQHEAAEDCLQRARTLFAALGDRPRTARAESVLAAQWIKQGHLEQALETLRACQTTFTDVGDRFGESQALTQIGQILCCLKRYPESAAALEQAVALRRESDLGKFLAFSLHYLGITYQKQERWADSQIAFAEAVSRLQEHGDFANAGIDLFIASSFIVDGVYYLV